MCGSYYSVHSAAHVEWLRPGVRQTLMLLLLLLVLLVGIPAANGEPLPFSLTPGTMQQQQHQQQLAVCFTRMNGIQNQFDLCSNAYVCPPIFVLYRAGARLSQRCIDSVSTLCSVVLIYRLRPHSSAIFQWFDMSAFDGRAPHVYRHRLTMQVVRAAKW